MVLALKLVLLTISSLSYNNNDIMLKRQALLSPCSAIWLRWGRITPSKSTLLPGLKHRIRLVFSSCCLSWKRLFPNTHKASKAPSDGWDSGDGAKAPRPGRGESLWCRLAVFWRKRAKPMSSCAPGQTRFITVSPTCLRVPKVCHCLPGSDPGVVARQPLRAQTCFLNCIFAVSGVLRPWGAEVGAQGGRRGTGCARKEWKMSPSVFLRGKAGSWGVLWGRLQPWDEPGRMQK